MYVVQGVKGYAAVNHYHQSREHQLFFVRKGGIVLHQYFEKPYRALIFMFDDEVIKELISEYPTLLNTANIKTRQELKEACQKSNETLRNMSEPVQWQHSYVTNDKLYCVYIAENKEAVQEHAAKSGFPADRIEKIRSIIDPVSAE